MSSALAWNIACAAVAALLALWNYLAWRELTARQKELAQLLLQVRVSSEAVCKAQSVPDEELALQALDTKRAVYLETARVYNAKRKRLFYRIPAAILGLPPAADI